MAAIKINTYLGLYVAAGIHSGLPYSRAGRIFSALVAMKVAHLHPMLRGAPPHGHRSVRWLSSWELGPDCSSVERLGIIVRV